MKTTELRQQRAKLIADARALCDKADAEKRALNAEEQTQIDKLSGEAENVKNNYERIERLEADERDLANSQGSHVDREVPCSQGEQRSAYKFELRGQSIEFQPGSPEWNRHQPEARNGFKRYLSHGETRALQTSQDTMGGYLTTPEQFVAEYIKAVDDAVLIRKLARKFTTIASSIGAPKRTSKMSTFAWGSELSTPTADTSLKFGKRTMSPHYMTGEILVSRDLLSAAVMDPEQIVLYELARDAGELEENAFMAGSGSGCPLGLFTNSTDGISSARDVSTGNTATSIGTDGLIEAKYTLKTQYRANASWIFPRAAIKQIRKLKDGEGQYLWAPSLISGEPDRLLNMPFYESEFAPSVFQSGALVGILGDFNFYWIVDRLVLQLQRLVEKYAEQNQVAFLSRSMTDGAPILEEAFARVKLA